jgi:hypothetical protein
VAPANPVAAESSVEPSDTAPDPASLLPALPSLSSRKTSLIGGTIEKLDRVRDQLTLRVFGAGKIKIYFDPRTRIYNGGNEASAADLRPGVRISVDTVLDGSTVFARNIRLNTTAGGETQGVVIGYNGSDLTVRDILSPHSLKLRVTPQTHVVEGDRVGSATQLVAGTLVAVKFGSQKDGRNMANEIAILATPASSFTFAGHVTALDLSAGLLVLTSATDGKTYEIYLDQSAGQVSDNLRQAADVTVLTRFDGKRYVAENVTVN